MNNIKQLYKKNTIKIKMVTYFIILFSSFFSISVNAETFQCEYAFGTSGWNYIFEYDTTNGTVTNLNEKEDAPATNWEYGYHFVDGEIEVYKKGECQTLYLKYTLECDQQGCDVRHDIYSDSFLREESSIDECVLSRDDFCLELFFGKSIKYYTGVLKEDSKINKENGNMDVNKCPSYNKFETKLIEKYEVCKNTNSCTNEIVEANEYIKKIKNLCNLILQHRDVQIASKDEIIEDECVKSCLNFSDRIVELKKEYGIVGSNNQIGECDFSERLLSWVSNILRWIKYILPVLVIVLGILDFMKAIGVDKDDEMKKAQKRFVTRLIAAALAFIIPLIIEFILTKMGFGYDSCGLF